MKAVVLALITLLAAGVLCAQQPKTNPRVFVTDSESWQIAGGFGSSSSGAAGGARGGARPQTAEIIKTVGEQCKNATVTINKENADYILMLEHEGGKGALRKDNKWALFDKAGDAVKSGSTRALGNSVKDACKALVDHWQKK